MDSQDWMDADSCFVPAPDEVHVWRVNLEAGPDRVGEFRKILSGDERERADRFHFEKDRVAFTVARAAARSILGACLEANPCGLVFQYGPQGKPALDGAAANSGLRFNVSHSGQLALVAVTRDREIGVDIERIRPLKAGDRLPERFFSQAEVKSLRALPETKQLEGFFTCWTRKEAYIKAKGGGLSVPLDQFTVSLAPGEPPALLDVRWDLQEPRRWTFANLYPEDGYAAALIAEGSDWTLKRWQWE
jgi:4'-phosphopantetheinyl transferase